MHPVDSHATRHGLRSPGILTIVVAVVWLVHGLYNKLLDGSPRHLTIVQAIPGLHGIMGERVLQAVGIAEVGLALWVLSGSLPLLCAFTQTIALISMNALELTFARHLLLWPAGLIPLNIGFLGLAWWVASAQPAIPVCTRLRRHPIPISARLQHCLTITYAVPATILRRLLPPGLELDTRGDYGFVAVALVQARSLRPAWLPRALGQDFFLAGYRIFTTFRCADGRRIRGLRIVRSDTDCLRMVVGGNLLTHYQYHRCDATIDAASDRLHVAIRTPDGAADLDVTADLTNTSLPAGSPFPSVREARRFAGPLPFTFDYEADTHSIIAINATRTNWKPMPVAVDVKQVSFFDQPEFAGCTPRLAAAFQVRDVAYRWERGVRISLDREVEP